MLITLLNILFNQFLQMLNFKSRVNFLVMSNMKIIHIDFVHHLLIRVLFKTFTQRQRCVEALVMLVIISSLFI
jgi:hypothetical protein